MSGLRVSDPSRLHLKKELTQIRKAARVLRDPGTTSSWKSPLNSSGSLAVSKNNLDFQTSRQNGNINLQLDSQNWKGKEKRVFLYNWKNQKSSSEKSELGRNVEEEEDEDGDDVSSWIQASADDDLSDARNGGDSKSDSASKILRCRDASVVSLGVQKIRKNGGGKKKSKKNSTHFDLLSRYQQKESIFDKRSVNNWRFVNGNRPAIAVGVGRDDSVDQSDDTEDYSPFLLKLKHKNWSRSSSKFLKTSRKEDSSCTYNSTPALSISSFNRYAIRNPSTVGSWDATTTSINDGDDELDDNLDLPGRQGCGIPCYWTRRTPKHRGGCRSCCSPSLSDTLRRTGSSILCGSQSVCRRPRHGSAAFNKQKIASRSAKGVLPLLTYSADGRGGSSIGTGFSDDELSTNLGELDLEAQSRLDGRRWSTSCRSRDGLEIVAVNEEGEEESTPENIRSLSQKYKPMFFDELIGQNLVVQSLMNAVTRARIAPVYLFQGPRGTGKTSAARIFAAALNCVATEETKPCGYCRECADFISGKSKCFLEIDGTNKNGVDKVRYLLKSLMMTLPSSYSGYKVFVIDECHLLPSKTWISFLKFLEDPPQQVVFIFITTDLDNVPRTIQSRCQKYIFNKIKDSDMVARLGKIAGDENLNVEPQALDLIALNADGSLRDAETMLEQLSLLGRRITPSLVNELVGVVSDEKLLELLELAMASDTAETVKRARELLDSGADPIVLMSQMASLIMDIITGTYKIADKYSSPFLGGQNVNEAELERLTHALKFLSEAEKQLRVSSDRSTWFTATLLQLGSMPSPETTLTGSSRRQNSKTTEDDPSSISREAIAYKQKLGFRFRKSASPVLLRKAENGSFVHQRAFSSEVNGYKSSDASVASFENDSVGSMMLTCRSTAKLNDIWIKCIEKCHSKTLRQLLCTHGKLLSISEVKGVLVAYIAFGESDIKSRAERFLSSITNAIEMVLRHNVEVRIILLPESSLLFPDKTDKKMNPEMGGEDPVANHGSNAGSPGLSSTEAGSVEEIPMQRIESIIREQRLETAWLQAAEKGTPCPGSSGQTKPEKNQVLPQEDALPQTNLEPVISSGLSSQQWLDGLSSEAKVLKVGDGREHQKDGTDKRTDQYPLSPSLLHDISFSNNKDSLGYESGSGGGGCSMLFCWNKAKPCTRNKVKGTPVGSHRGKSGKFLLFGRCAKPRKTEGRVRR